MRIISCQKDTTEDNNYVTVLQYQCKIQSTNKNIIQIKNYRIQMKNI